MRARRRPSAPPRRSGRRGWRDAPFAALDFETTGLDLRRDAVVSFGVVPVEDGRIDLSGSLYQEVAPNVPISPVSVRIHELRPVDLRDAPSLSRVAPELRARLEGRFILVWSAAIETAFLRRMFGGREGWWRRRMLDVHPLAASFYRLTARPVPKPLSLEAVVADLGIPVEESHHALDDAFMTAEVFLVVASALAAHGWRTVRSLIERPPTPRRSTRS